MPLLSPDGRLLAVVDGPVGARGHRVLELDTGRDQWLEGLPDDATLASFSPGGRELLYFAWDRSAARMGLWVRPLGSGPARLLAHYAEHRGASWGPDGEIVYNRHDRGGPRRGPGRRR